MTPDITQPVISIAWQQCAIALGCCFIIAVLIQSSAFKDVVRAFRLSPWRSLIMLLVAVSWFTLQGSTKAPDVVGKLFKLLFWSPSSPWSLAEPSAKIQDAESAVAYSSNVLVEASGVITNNVSGHSLSTGTRRSACRITSVRTCWLGRRRLCRQTSTARCTKITTSHSMQEHQLIRR